jgi:putative Mn2+ efflux pump MntP
MATLGMMVASVSGVIVDKRAELMDGIIPIGIGGLILYEHIGKA